MKHHIRITAFSISMLLCAGASRAQQPDTIAYANTIAVTPQDTEASIIAKAAHVVPTPNQMSALQNEFIAFIHFGPNTFTRKEWGNGVEDPKVFDLKELHTDQWCEAMKAAGMKMVLLTVKHHDGFVLWQSRYTRHGIMSSPFQNGKGDVLRELSRSCQKYGLKLGIYLSPADLFQIESPDGLYGNLSPKTKRRIPRPVDGRPFANTTTFEFEVDDYNEYFLNQLFELLTEYGPIHELWFDGAHPKRKGGQTYDYAAWKKLIRTLAPEAVIFGREDVRWCGNESGATRDTEWNVIPYPMDPDTASHFADLTAVDLGSRERLKEGRYLHYQQPETDTSIREGWFYRDETDQRTRSADDVFDIYERSVGGNATFLLNIPPNREGRFSQRDVDVLTDVGERIRSTYGHNLLPQGTQAPAAIVDGDPLTGTPVEGSFEVRMPQSVTFNRVMLQEAVATSGERVEEHAVDAWVDGQWKQVAHATNIGYKRILRMPEVTTDRLRVRILSSRLTPVISHLALCRYDTRPPQLACSRSKEGMVELKAVEHAFGWKNTGEDIAANLNQGYTIHYTTDGTQPDASSPRYERPFPMGAGLLKAVSVSDGRTGAVMEKALGMAKTAWQAAATEGADEKHTADKAFDENTATYWQSQGSQLPMFTVDLGGIVEVNGFAYTPQLAEKGKGMMAGGNVWVSTDGRKWKKKGTFSFGNLTNDPTQRFFRLKKAVKARFLRLEATQTADGTPTVCIAELDVM